jgi:hypothetical protein
MSDRIDDRNQKRALPDVDELTVKQRAVYERLRALSGEAARHKVPGATSDHRDMYDDFGLPRGSWHRRRSI